jgi:hypothetical protein
MKLALITAAVLLAGCSSTTPKKTAQFCNTNQTIEVQNGKQVESKTVVKCSDNFLDRHVPARAGVDRNCREVITQYGRSFACETHRPGRIIYIPNPEHM